MGYIKHHAIVVTSWDFNTICEVATDANKLFRSVAPVSGLLGPGVNGYYTLCIAPDGSKEDWDDSAKGDVARNLFMDSLEKRSQVSWVLLSFGDEQGPAKIIREDGYDENEESETP
jgi:hypothetical protein